jgi:hypothetical protein
MMFGLAAATAPAGNRAPNSGMAADPGPTEATYGTNVAFTATLDNFQKSAFVTVRLEVEFPKTRVGTVETLATFKATSCPVGTYELLENPKRFVCYWGDKLPAGQIAKVLVVWETPVAGTSSDCPTAISEPCMTTKGTWFIKEGSQTKGGGPDTFPTSLAAVSFLDGTDPGKKARGYALGHCTEVDDASELATAPGGEIQTTVCPSTTPGSAFPFTPGLIMQIDHGKGSFSKKLPTSFICIPDPRVSPSSCPAAPGYGGDGYTPWTFADPAKFTFVLTTLNITKVLHDGEDVTSTCVITPDKALKKTTITCLGDENGGWDFG